MKILLLLFTLTIVLTKKTRSHIRSHQFEPSVNESNLEEIVNERQEINLDDERKEKRSEEAGAKVMKDIENMGNYSQNDYEEDQNGPYQRSSYRRRRMRR